MNKRFLYINDYFRRIDLHRVQLIENDRTAERFWVTLVNGVKVIIPYSVMSVEAFEKSYLAYFGQSAEDDNNE